VPDDLFPKFGKACESLTFTFHRDRLLENSPKAFDDNTVNNVLLLLPIMLEVIPFVDGMK